MQVTEKVLSYKRPDQFHLYFIGDIHLGTEHCAEEKIRDKIKEIKNDPFALVIGMGDYAEFISPKDPRWEPSQRVIPDWMEQDNTAHCQEQRVISLFNPIKDKIIGLLYGNHEDSIRKHSHQNVHKNICEELGVENLGYMAFIHLRLHRGQERHLFKICATHGTGGARTDPAKLGYLKRFMEDFDANIYAYAHVHCVQIYAPDILTSTQDLELSAKHSIGVLTGCWFRTYTKGIIASYGETRLYRPSKIGCPMITLIPDKGIIKAEQQVELVV